MDAKALDSSDLLAGLTPAQVEAVTNEAAPLCILAGAGSGKTRVLTRRIAHRVAVGRADPRHVLALTFTRKAAHELSERLRSLGVRDSVVAGTFHSVAYAALRQRWADAGRSAPTLLDRKGRVLGRLLARARLADSITPAELAGEIEWAKARLVPAKSYEREAFLHRRRSPVPASTVATLFREYEAEKQRRGLVDFDDLVVLCGEALATDAGFAARQRWRFRHLYVDEFQDVNPAQARLLEGWRGEGLDLCVVGDPDQSIYAWNGADPGVLTGFADRFPAATVLSLDDNFRSTPQILAVATAVLRAGGAPSRPVQAHRGEGPVPTVVGYPSEEGEARAVAGELRRRHCPGSPWARMAVLFRSHAQSAALGRALAAEGIPYRVRGAHQFLDDPGVRAALDELARRPGLFRAHLADLEAESGDDEPDAELARLGRDFLVLDPLGSTEAFLAWLAASSGPARDTSAPGGDAVDLCTFHAAKGLEWPVVFIVGLEQGLVPIRRARTVEQQSEERRLLYVAATRAEHELHCSWAASRTFGTWVVPRSPSPWLSSIAAAAEAAHPCGAGGSPDWRAELHETRRALRATSGARSTRPGLAVVGAGADPQVLAALQAWRRTAARAAGVPGHVIFHDTTLRAVAEARPRDRATLLALPGLGPVKADRFGDALLQVVAEHLAS